MLSDVEKGINLMLTRLTLLATLVRKQLRLSVWKQNRKNTTIFSLTHWRP